MPVRIDRRGHPDPDALPQGNVQSKAAGHCGAGCTLGDIGAGWLVFGRLVRIGWKETR